MKYRLGDFTFDGDARQLLRHGAEVHLSRKAFELLSALVLARPLALSKSDLHAVLWPDTFVSDANLAMVVAELRKALDDDARTPRFVRTVQRYGYAFHGAAIEMPPGRRSASDPSGLWLIAPFRQIPLVAGENIVGREPGAQVWLDLPGVSRRHARIVVDGVRVTLEDLNSKNGTRLRGAAVTTTRVLADGDDIRFGSTTLTFRSWAAGDVTRTEHDA